MRDKTIPAAANANDVADLDEADLDAVAGGAARRPAPSEDPDMGGEAR